MNNYLRIATILMIFNMGGILAGEIPEELKDFYFLEHESGSFYFFDTKDKLKEGNYSSYKKDFIVRTHFEGRCYGIFTGNSYYKGDVKGFEKNRAKSASFLRMSAIDARNKFQEIKVIKCDSYPNVDGQVGFYTPRTPYRDSRGPYFKDSAKYNEKLNEIYLRAKTNNNIPLLTRIYRDFSHVKVSMKAKIVIDGIKKKAWERTNNNKKIIESEYRSLLSINSEIKKKNNFAKKWRINKSVDNIKYQDAISLDMYNNLLMDIYAYYNKKTNIKSYVEFINIHPHASQVSNAILNIYNIIADKNNISGYEWFVTKYSRSLQVKDAITNIHMLAFNKAKNINTISSYNTYIITYPVSEYVKNAQIAAYKLEVKKYTDLGFFGEFFEKSEKMEKKARKLLIKAKQIERNSSNYRWDARQGYMLVVDRMYRLLQEKFDEADATLRYLESEEFKDFVQEFRSVMTKINHNLKNIEGYSREIVEVSRKGFSDANADRGMAAYKLAEHEKWEKFMHFRDVGYQ